MDDLSAEDLKAVPLQDIAATVADLGAIVQICGEAEVTDTIIVLILTNQEDSVAPILEVHFVGNPTNLDRMMVEGSKAVKRLSKDAIDCINRAEGEIDPWEGS